MLQWKNTHVIILGDKQKWQAISQEPWIPNMAQKQTTRWDESKGWEKPEQGSQRSLLAKSSPAT